MEPNDFYRVDTWGISPNLSDTEFFQTKEQVDSYLNEFQNLEESSFFFGYQVYGSDELISPPLEQKPTQSQLKERFPEFFD